MKLIVVGGVAGGASAAARARRLNERAEIVLFERGEYISFANCGLPYHVGNVIANRDDLMVMTPAKFKGRTAIDVRVRHEVIAVDPEKHTVTVRRTDTGETVEEPYDKLILATGSSPVLPPFPGADRPEVLKLWTIPDMDRVVKRLEAGARKAVVVGAGFIGLEVAENLRERGVEVDLVEMLPQVLPTLDPEMARPLEKELAAAGVRLHLNRKVVEVRDGNGGASVVRLDDETLLDADFVVVSAGVRPNSELAATAGLALSERKGILVDEHLRTSNPDIYAVGDVIAFPDATTGEAAMVPLAGPANRQGRIAAENACGGDAVYAGAIGTSVVKIFRQTAAGCGLNEKRLKAMGRPYRKAYLHAANHATYYPGAAMISMKLLFDDDGAILGFQAVGEQGADKRVDVVATAMKGGLTVRDLAELELAYAPPYGSAKDPVNVAGMVAVNQLDGKTDLVAPDGIPEDALLLDVREPAETELGVIEGARLIPLGKLRERLGELPRDQRIVVYCRVGLRGYLGERILKQNGFTAANLTGGWLSWKMFHPDPLPKAKPGLPAPVIPPGKDDGTAATPDTSGPATRSVDVRALQCPGPVVRVRNEIEAMAPGETLDIRAPRSFCADLEAWVESTGNSLLRLDRTDDGISARVMKGLGTAPGSAACTPGATPPDSAAIVCFSNDLDKVLAAFIIATGLATLGVNVSMFFTFWGLSVLRKQPAPSVAKDILSRMFGFMLPKGATDLALSKMHMMGMGTAMMKHVMAKKNVNSLPELVREARALGVKFIACDMAMNVMGLSREELLEDVDEVAGVAAFAALAKSSGTTLFI